MEAGGCVRALTSELLLLTLVEGRMDNDGWKFGTGMSFKRNSFRGERLVLSLEKVASRLHEILNRRPPRAQEEGVNARPRHEATKEAQQPVEAEQLGLSQNHFEP